MLFVNGRAQGDELLSSLSEARMWLTFLPVVAIGPSRPSKRNPIQQSLLELRIGMAALHALTSRCRMPGREFGISMQQLQDLARRSRLLCGELGISVMALHALTGCRSIPYRKFGISVWPPQSLACCRCLLCCELRVGVQPSHALTGRRRMSGREFGISVQSLQDLTPCRRIPCSELGARAQARHALRSFPAACL